MTRTQKKCFIAATGSHLLLVVMLFVGPGFFTSKAKMEEVNLITIVPEITTYEKVQPGGGSPKGGTPPPQAQPQPEPPKPAAPAKVEKPPEPQAKETKVEKDDPNAFESAPKSKPKISLKQVVRKDPTQTAKNTATKPSSNSNSTTASRDLQAVNSMVKTLRSGLSTSTSVDMPLGPGGGGPTYANFYDAVGKIYYDAWVEPEIESSGEMRVEASVTIARSGEVLASRVTKPSGNPAVDQSVQATLNRVRFAVPLPAGSGESQKVVPIGFTARIKKGTG